MLKKIKLREKTKRLIDAISIFFILILTLIVIDACRINMQETPIDGVPQGSSYIATAIGNPDWVADHPNLAQIIKDSEFIEKIDGFLLLASVVLLLTLIYTLPAICMIYLMNRLWSKRKNLLYSTPMSILIFWLVYITTFIHEAVAVMMD